MPHAARKTSGPSPFPAIRTAATGRLNEADPALISESVLSACGSVRLRGRLATEAAKQTVAQRQGPSARCRDRQCVPACISHTPSAPIAGIPLSPDGIQPVPVTKALHASCCSVFVAVFFQATSHHGDFQSRAAGSLPAGSSGCAPSWTPDERRRRAGQFRSPAALRR